jgi:hypothetical protein
MIEEVHNMKVNRENWNEMSRKGKEIESNEPKYVEPKGIKNKQTF